MHLLGVFTLKNACSRKVQIVVVLHARSQPEGWGALVTLFFFHLWFLGFSSNVGVCSLLVGFAPSNFTVGSGGVSTLVQKFKNKQKKPSQGEGVYSQVDRYRDVHQSSTLKNGT